MIKEAPVSEDFTFPVIKESNSLYSLHFPTFTASSIWYVSSTASDLGDAKQQACKGKFSPEARTHQRRSFSSIEGSRRVDDRARELELLRESYVDSTGSRDEEKMDMLWEDLNEESSQPSLEKRGVETPKGQFMDPSVRYESNTDAARIADLYCVHALEMPKGSGILPHRKSSLVLVLKVLKKMFLIHNSHCPKGSSCVPHH